MLILYMRRVHCFNYLNCRQHRSPLDVVAEGGEAYLFANLVLNFTQQRQPYGWQVAHAALLPAEKARLVLECSALGEIFSDVEGERWARQGESINAQLIASSSSFVRRMMTKMNERVDLIRASPSFKALRMPLLDGADRERTESDAAAAAAEAAAAIEDGGGSNGGGSNGGDGGCVMRRGILLPAGTRLVVSPASLHQHPRHWPQPCDTPRPEFFTHAAQKSRTPGSFLPFSTGAKGCPASGFALHEMRVLLVMLLQRFELAAVGAGGVLCTPRAAAS